MKKRLWPRARVGTLSEMTALLVHDAGSAMNAVRVISWPVLLAHLEVVENIYAAGMPKSAIRESLYLASKKAGEIGLAPVRNWEEWLGRMRNAPEFAIATLIAQKPLETETEAEPHDESHNITQSRLL